MTSPDWQYSLHFQSSTEGDPPHPTEEGATVAGSVLYLLVLCDVNKVPTDPLPVLGKASVQVMVTFIPLSLVFCWFFIFGSVVLIFGYKIFRNI